MIMKKAIAAILFLAGLGISDLVTTDSWRFVPAPVPLPTPIPGPHLDCGCSSDYECLFGGFGCGDSFHCTRIHGPIGAGTCQAIER